MPQLHPLRSLRPVRPRLPRRALPWYGAAGLLALITALAVHGTLSRAAEAEAAYGRTRPVVVVVAPVPAGRAIGPDDVEVRPWPEALVPPGALPRLPDPATALVALEAGEVLLGSRVAGHGRDGPAALLGADERAVAVPLAVVGVPLAPGDEVDLLAGGGFGGGPDGDLPVAVASGVVARSARVLEADDEVVVVAVEASVASDVAAALTAGPIVVALRPAG